MCGNGNSSEFTLFPAKVDANVFFLHLCLTLTELVFKTETIQVKKGNKAVIHHFST